MKSWNLRIKRDSALIEWLRKNKKKKRQLTTIEDRYFKPLGVSLNRFHPQKRSLRIRLFSKKAQLAFLPFVYKERTYSHGRYVFFEGFLKEAGNIVSELGFEEWGRQKIKSSEYSVNYKNKRLIILDEFLNGKNRYFKIEAFEEKVIIDFLKKFKIPKRKFIRKNMIWLLAREKKLC